MPDLNGRSHGPGSSPSYAAAFNEGVDARLLGKPARLNPYSSADFSRYTGWAHGWRHCQDNWAADVRGRWWFRRLPQVLPLSTWEDF